MASYFTSAALLYQRCSVVGLFRIGKHAVRPSDPMFGFLALFLSPDYGNAPKEMLWAFLVRARSLWSQFSLCLF